MSADAVALASLVTWGQLVADPGRMFVLGLALLALGWAVHRLPLPRAGASPDPPRRP